MRVECQTVMSTPDNPGLVFGISLIAFWIAAWVGAWFRARQRPGAEDIRGDFAFILGGALTLLGLIVGFTFSMAVSRYDQRKNYEEQEANAIGTEYVRADLLPSADAGKVRGLLKSYLDQRILAYTTRGAVDRRQLDARTARLQAELWSALVGPATAAPTPVMALVVGGMNDVLNSQGYTQAAWWNRIPRAAWTLVFTISIFCNLLVGYVAHGRSAILFLILPIALSTSFFLIADIDTPLGGVIRVWPQNLMTLADSLRSP
jgi:hypothetical protein